MYCQQCGHPTREEHLDGHTRPVCTTCGAVTYLDPKLAVAVLISQDDRVLLGKRAEHTRQPGKWSFPAGFVERGEAVEAAAIRETQEETGLTVEPGPLLSLISAPGETVVLAVFPTATWTGTPVPGDDLVEVRWFPFDRLPELAFDHDNEIIEQWRLSKHTESMKSAPRPD